jgi:ribosomal protein S11
MNVAVETGFLETALTVAGLPMAAAGVMVYRKSKKKKAAQMAGETIEETAKKTLINKLFG